MKEELTIQQIEERNQISKDRVFNNLEQIYKETYEHNESLYLTIARKIAEKYPGVVTDKEIQVAIYNIPKPVLEEHDIRIAELNMQMEELANFRKKVLADLEHETEVRASQYPEWNLAMVEFIKSQIQPDNFCVNDDDDDDDDDNDIDNDVVLGVEDFYVNGEYSLGRSFHTQFKYIDYDGGYVPFHCYATQGSLLPDVLFTYQEHQWDPVSGLYDFELKEKSEEQENRTKVIGIVIVALAFILTAIAFISSFASVQ